LIDVTAGDFNPTREQIETIVDMVTARMPSDAIARALGLESGEFMTWGSRLAKTRSLDLKIRNPEPPRPESPSNEARIDVDAVFGEER
jgi:hypothetical protein